MILCWHYCFIKFLAHMRGADIEINSESWWLEILDMIGL